MESRLGDVRCGRFDKTSTFWPLRLDGNFATVSIRITAFDHWDSLIYIAVAKYSGTPGRSVDLLLTTSY